MTHQCTEVRFLKDVAEHQMEVIRDDGVYRHVRFKRPGTNCMHFDLITWPGYLCYTGDMGTYVFSRIRDMFEFFRTDRKYGLRDGQTLAINPPYWGEKLEAIDTHGGFREWSKDKFEKRIREDFAQWLEDSDLEPEQKAEATEQFESDVICSLDEGDQENAYRVAMDFEIDGERPFQDWWEVNTEEFTFRFLWCCYALAWGIQKYDEAHPVSEAA